MSDDVSPANIKKTQDSLGKYVKKPLLTEKLLKKPPFRFLHDIISVVMQEHGVFQGLFNQDELESANVKDKESKIAYLNKVIEVLKKASGKSLTVRANKVVAGHEASNTNQMLQLIAFVIDKKIDTSEAVSAVTSSTTGGATSKTTKPATRKTQEDTKTSQVKRGVAGARQQPEAGGRGTRTKRETNEPKQRGPGGSTTTKPPSETKGGKGVKADSGGRNNQGRKSEGSPPKKVQEVVEDKNTEEALGAVGGESFTLPDEEQGIDQEVMPTVEPSYLITDNETQQQQLDNKSPSPTRPGTTTRPGTSTGVGNEGSFFDMDEMENKVNEDGGGEVLQEGNQQINQEENNRSPSPRPRTRKGSRLPPSQTEDTTDTQQQQEETNTIPDRKPSAFPDQRAQSGVLQPHYRPPSSRAARRPPSARPAPPRVRERQNIVEEPIPGPSTAPRNVIIDKAENDMEEEFLVQIGPPQGSMDNAPDNRQTDTLANFELENHGHLVEQILQTQKALEKVEVTKDASVLDRERDAYRKKIDGLQLSIQKYVSQVTRLSHRLDFVQEDVDSMQGEWEKYHKEVHDSYKQIQQEEHLTEEILKPLKLQLNEVEQALDDQMTKTNQLKSKLIENEENIRNLLPNSK